ncbi:hypothetical protein [Streptomyces glomeratus]|uniref:nSTAND1 domain-containing NTPase n=1 Tax=Streptomyces glomeratus TaxID=284452 RepID=UPI00355841F8
MFGPSGSGKSSLLRAGLIPRLRSPEATGPQPAAVRVLDQRSTRPPASSSTAHRSRTDVGRPQP